MKTLLIAAILAAPFMGVDPVATRVVAQQPGRPNAPRQFLYHVQYRIPGGKWRAYRTYQFAGQAVPIVNRLKSQGYEARYWVSEAW